MRSVLISMLLLLVVNNPSLSSPFLSTGNSNTDSLLGGAALGVAGGLLLGKYKFCPQKARTYYKINTVYVLICRFFV
jgi:hypothetical protein